MFEVKCTSFLKLSLRDCSFDLISTIYIFRTTKITILSIVCDLEEYTFLYCSFAPVFAYCRFFSPLSKICRKWSVSLSFDTVSPSTYEPIVEVASSLILRLIPFGSSRSLMTSLYISRYEIHTDTSSFSV